MHGRGQIQGNGGSGFLALIGIEEGRWARLHVGDQIFVQNGINEDISLLPLYRTAIITLCAVHDLCHRLESAGGRKGFLLAQAIVHIRDRQHRLTHSNAAVIPEQAQQVLRLAEVLSLGQGVNNVFVRASVQTG